MNQWHHRCESGVEANPIQKRGIPVDWIENQRGRYSCRADHKSDAIVVGVDGGVTVVCDRVEGEQPRGVRVADVGVVKVIGDDFRANRQRGGQSKEGKDV